MRCWAQFVSKRPAVCSAVALLITIVFAAALPRIGFDIRPNATFLSDNQASRDLARLHDVFGPDDNDVVLMVESPTLLQWETLEAVRGLQRRLEAIPDVRVRRQHL
jgi:predicted RND superfamily exporter protein